MTPPATATAPHAPLDVVRAHPLCAETPAPLLAHAITPAASVYVRSNFPTPVLDAAHRLSIGGAVDTAFTIGLEELAQLPQHEVLVTIECAGNWRLAMEPVPEGEPWTFGAVSTTRWRGVPLVTLLQRAGVHADAIEVLATGADAGPRDDAEGLVTFARALPLDVARHPDTLIATHMDGAPLTSDHGAPARLIVPGWYGMASVKWLTQLELRTTRYAGYFQQRRYVYETAHGITPVDTVRVKSMIVTATVTTSPDEGARRLQLEGWAWSGAAPIARVDVQVNDGAWTEASLDAPLSRWAWTRWHCEVPAPTGTVTLRSRATDRTGATQPERIEWNRLGYGNNAMRRVTVPVA